jgi:hypothetical protein
MNDFRLSKSQDRWYHLTPDRLLVGLLMAEGFLFLADRLAWLGSTPESGWNVLLALVLVGVAILIGLFWLGVSLLLRCRFQFSIRSLCALTLSVAIACSWFAVKTQRARKQRDAVRAIEATPGWVEYDWQQFDRFGILTSRPSSPTWLRDLLGPDFFDSVVAVGLHLSPVTDEGLARLKALKTLKRVSLSDTNITDSGLEHLKGLTNLEYLDIRATQVSDTGVAYLEKLSELRILRLSSPGITDAGLEHLKGLANLEELWLNNTKVGDAGLEHLKDLGNLQELHLADTQVTNAGLEHLIGLKNLRHLDLDNTQVTDEGMKRLREALPNCKCTADRYR